MFTPHQFMVVARPVVLALARSHPELEPLALALADAMTKLFPDATTQAGPERPPRGP